MHSTHYQEADAFTALQSGKEASLQYYFNRWYAPLLLYTTSITKESFVAEEIVADSFQKLWIKRSQLTYAAGIKPFLYRVAGNAAIDYLRQQRTERKKASLYVAKEADANTVLHKMVEAEVYDQLYQALKNLPPKPRRIFELFYFQQKTISEIALELGTTADAVKGQKKRAMQLLREASSSLMTIFVVLLVVLLR